MHTRTCNVLCPEPYFINLLVSVSVWMNLEFYAPLGTIPSGANAARAVITTDAIALWGTTVVREAAVRSRYIERLALLAAVGGLLHLRLHLLLHRPTVRCSWGHRVPYRATPLNRYVHVRCVRACTGRSTKSTATNAGASD